MRRFSQFSIIFVQFKKHEKHPWKSASKFAD